MKFSITYIRKDVNQTALIEAADEHTARAYFTEYKTDAEILDISPATADDERPGKTCITVPADYSAPVIKVSISKGNSKMGAVPSVSLPPIVTCPAGCPCAKKCYAAKLCRRYKNVKESYARNLAAYNANPASFELQVESAAMLQRYFRWHVAGDILNPDYFAMMVRIAKRNPNTQFLAFTKQYAIVNDYISNVGQIPGNLHVIFSLWDSAWNVRVHNPHNLPTSAVIFKDSKPTVEYTKICGGNCTECAMRGVGCWELKAGETIAFYEH